MKDKWIVLTTINQPSGAILEYSEFSRRNDWGMVVVGDTKTPPDWNVPGVEYLSIDRQNDLFGEFSKAVPTRHYARKNLGYLYAMTQGARVILETDDDNRPYPKFGTGLDIEVEGKRIGGTDWANVYRHFTDKLIWPRGLPLDRIHEAGNDLGTMKASCPVQQFLADADPDVDAIYRLLFKDNLTFNKSPETVILGKGTYCPYNSQNTLHFKECFDLLYLPSHVSFRMTDIWRSFVAQRVLWSRGYELCFHPATVYQSRNEHDLMRDFKDETEGYLRNKEMGLLLSGLKLESGAKKDALSSCYQELARTKFVPAMETELAGMWIRMMEMKCA